MLIIGCDYHPAFQQCRAFLAHRRGFHDTLPTASTCSRAADLKCSAFVDTATGDWSTARERRNSTVIWRHKE